MNQTIGLYSHTSIYSLLTPDIHMVNIEQTLVTMSASLHTQTGLPSFTIQIQNAELTSIVTQHSVLNSVTLYMTI